MPGSLSLVRNRALPEPPCGLSPHASASSSTTVDLPEPFSPTRTVRPGVSSRPSARICSTAGTVAGHRVVSMPASGLDRTHRIMRVSVSHPEAPTAP